MFLYFLDDLGYKCNHKDLFSKSILSEFVSEVSCTSMLGVLQVLEALEIHHYFPKALKFLKISSLFW